MQIWTEIVQELELCLGFTCLSGIMAIAAVFAWPLFERRSTALTIQCFGAGAFALHFLSIGAPTAAVSSCVAISQLVAASLWKKRATLVALYGISIVALLVLAALSWSGIPSLLPVLGSSIATAARLQPSTARMKTLFVMSAPFWVAHNILVGSTFGLAVDAVSTSCNTATLVRWRLRHPNRIRSYLMRRRADLRRQPVWS